MNTNLANNIQFESALSRRTRIGIGQIWMHWSIEENTQQICQIIERNKDVGVFAFPELALTGFHRDICQQADSDKVRSALEQIARYCKRYAVTVLLGVPLANDGQQLMNRYIALDHRGYCVADWCKVGLTASEQRVFTAGSCRVGRLINDWSVNAIICREAFDREWFIEQCQRSTEPNLIFWPGYICHNQQNGHDRGMHQEICQLARQLNVDVLQVNWANSLNQPDINGMGASRIIDSNGQVRHTLPKDTPCLGVLDYHSYTLEIRSLAAY